MMISATELKMNLGKYLEMIQEMDDDLIITKNGKYIARISNPKKDALNYLHGLCKDVPEDVNIKDAKYERILEKHAKGLY